MKHIVRCEMSAAEVIGALDGMPKERGSDFMAGRIAAASVNRTYTRVDGDQFQISKSAGMGSPVVVSGKVTDDESGGAVVFMTTSFGLWPLGAFIVAGIILWAAGVYFLNAGVFTVAATSFVLSGFPIGSFIGKLRDARFLRSEISKYLGGAEWEPQK